MQPIVIHNLNSTGCGHRVDTHERFCCDLQCIEPEGTCPMFKPIEGDDFATKFRFYTRLTYCIALIGFGVLAFLQARGA